MATATLSWASGVAEDASPGKRQRTESCEHLNVASRAISAEEIMFGGIWIGAGGGPRGDGDRPDPGHRGAQ